MSNVFLEKLRSIQIAKPERKNLKKIQTDVHDHGTAVVTEHYDDRVDVTIKPDTIRVGYKN